MFKFHQTVQFLIYYDTNCFFITDSNAFTFTSWIGLFKYLRSAWWYRRWHYRKKQFYLRFCGFGDSI